MLHVLQSAADAQLLLVRPGLIAAHNNVVHQHQAQPKFLFMRALNHLNRAGMLGVLRHDLLGLCCPLVGGWHAAAPAAPGQEWAGASCCSHVSMCASLAHVGSF